MERQPQTLPGEVYLTVLQLTREDFRDMIDFLNYARTQALAAHDDSMHRRLTGFLAKLATDIERDLHSPL